MTLSHELNRLGNSPLPAFMISDDFGGGSMLQAGKDEAI